MAIRVLAALVAQGLRPWRIVSDEVQLGADNASGNFINLDHRLDRKAQVEKVLKSLGMGFVQRTSGVLDRDGALGCAKAHVKVLQAGIKSGREFIVILEDDVKLASSPNEIHAAISTFLTNPYLDVICLGNRTKGFQIPISSDLKIAFDIQTTSFYIAKRRALPALLASAERSVELLENGLGREKGAIDIVWKGLQRNELVFCVPRKKTIVQRASYSDVVKKFKDYGD